MNADGAGPYECDLDQTSKPQYLRSLHMTDRDEGNAATNFVPLTVANNVPGNNGLSQAKEADFTINVQMPANFNCIGASTGNICTVRCRNNAVAGPFGGCFAVQQTDGTGRTNTSAAGKSHQSFFSQSSQLSCNVHNLLTSILTSRRHCPNPRRNPSPDPPKPEGPTCRHRRQPSGWSRWRRCGCERYLCSYHCNNQPCGCD